MSPHCAIYIQDSKAIILQDTMGVWFKMMHHNTKFGYSILKSSEDILLTNILQSFKPLL